MEIITRESREIREEQEARAALRLKKEPNEGAHLIINLYKMIQTGLNKNEEKRLKYWRYNL